MIRANVVDQQRARGRSEGRQRLVAAFDQQERTDHRQPQACLGKRKAGIGDHTLQLLVEGHAAFQLAGGDEYPDQHARAALAGGVTAVAPEMVEVAMYGHGLDSSPGRSIIGSVVQPVDDRR
ncbi:hypothetical protein D3C72_1702780 [compost metagenome]